MTSYLQQVLKSMNHKPLTLKSFKKPKATSESRAHRLAKESVFMLAKSGKTLFKVDGRSFPLPKPSFIEIEKVWWWPPYDHGRRPVPGFSADVMMILDDRKIAIEIVVSNPPSDHKLAFYQHSGIECWVVKPADVSVGMITAQSVSYTGNETFDFSRITWDRPPDLIAPVRTLQPRRKGKKPIITPIEPYDSSKEGLFMLLRAVKPRYNNGAYTTLECLHRLKTEKGFAGDCMEKWAEILEACNEEDLSRSGWKYKDGFLIKR